MGLPQWRICPANVLCFVMGIMSKWVSWFDLSSHFGVGVLWIKSYKYWGPMWCRHLNVRTRILKVILCLTGSQWSSFKARVALSNLDLLSTKHMHTCSGYVVAYWLSSLVIHIAQSYSSPNGRCTGLGIRLLLYAHPRVVLWIWSWESSALHFDTFWLCAA